VSSSMASSSGCVLLLPLPSLEKRRLRETAGAWFGDASEFAPSCWRREVLVGVASAVREANQAMPLAFCLSCWSQPYTFRRTGLYCKCKNS
jgi:hypothetical protein